MVDAQHMADLYFDFIYDLFRITVSWHDIYINFFFFFFYYVDKGFLDSTISSTSSLLICLQKVLQCFLSCSA